MKDLFGYVIAIILLAFIVVSCKTDFDINAPYKPIPVIYGLLDQSQDTQFVKINKSFLGDGNNVDYAAINDSLLFTNVSARVEQWDNGSSPFKVYDLQELWVDNLQSGIFYTDSQKVFYFIPDSPMDDEHLYRLVVSVDDLQEDITAETYLLDGSELTFDFVFKQTFQYSSGLKLADIDLGTSDIYFNPTIPWKTTSGGKRYELLLSFRYNEVTSIGSQEKTIYWDLGTKTAEGTGSGLNGSQPMSKNFSGEQFFNMIDSRLKDYADEDQVIRREIKGLDFFVTAGNDDLNTYMEVNEPVTGVVTERPAFTNINGDGIGLFASKVQIGVTGRINDGTVLELCKGQVTGGSDLLSSKYKFCTDSTDQITSISNITGGENCGCN